MAKTAPVKKTSAALEKKRQEKALQICESSRAQLILQHPFVGRLGIQIPFLTVNDSRIHTIATNGKVIYFRPEWVCAMPPVTMTAIIAHTIWTAALCHSFRRGEHAPGRFDLASDIEVYKLLQVEKVNMARKPDFADLFPKHAPVEEIISKLPQGSFHRSPDSDVHLYTAGVVSIPVLPGEEEKKKSASSDPVPPEGRGSDGKGEGTCCTDGQGKGGIQEGKKGGKTQPGEGSVSEKSISDASPADGIGSEKSALCGSPQAGESLEQHHEADCECDPAMREVWRQRIIEAGQHYRMTYGELPGELAGLVEFFSQGRINYMQLLRRYLGQCSGGEAHWLPPARRFVWQGQYLPSRQNPKLEIVVAVDTSGSIDQEDFQDFFGEIASIVQTFPNYQLTLIQCDTAITDVQRFSREKPFDGCSKIEIKGGGGTSFVPVFEYLKEEKITPKVLLYYTDGCGTFPKAPKFPVLWFLTEESDVPWGKKILMADNSPGVSGR